MYIAPPANETDADAACRQNTLKDEFDRKAEEIQEACLSICYTQAGVEYIAPPTGETHADAALRRQRLRARCTFKEKKLY